MQILKPLVAVPLVLIATHITAQGQTGSYLMQAVSQGMPITVKMNCSADYGVFAKCRSYSVQYITDPTSSSYQKFVSAGPVAPLLYLQSAEYAGATALAAGKIVIWGAEFTIASDGQVYPSGQGTAVATAYINNTARALESGMPARLQVTASCGSPVPCGDYNVTYSADDAKYTAVGPVNYASGTPASALQIKKQSATLSPPAMEGIAINGSYLLFDKLGNLTASNAALTWVGNIKTVSFKQTVPPAISNSSPYVDTPIVGSAQCSPTTFNWNAAKTVSYGSELGSNVPSNLLVNAANAVPMTWSNFGNETHQYGYMPLFSPGHVSFAPNGRPVVLDRYLNLQVLNDNGEWVAISLADVARESLRRQNKLPWTKSSIGATFEKSPETEHRVVFDQGCHAYVVIDSARSNLGYSILMHSNNGGQSWAAYPLPPANDSAITFDLEVPNSASTALPFPPAIMSHARYVSHGASPKPLMAIFPQKIAGGALQLGSPVQIAAATVTPAHHSGFDSYVATSAAGITYFAYTGTQLTQDPTSLPVVRSGTPVWLQAFDRSTGTLQGSPSLLGVGLSGSNIAPADSAYDDHAGAALAFDSNGFLHAVIGGHGAKMMYRKSTATTGLTNAADLNNSSAWTPLTQIGMTSDPGTGGNYADTYSYPSMVVDNFNRVHVFARYSGSSYVQRLHHVMNYNGTWTAPKEILNPGRSFYAAWYHKAATDGWGRIFLSFSYTPGELFAGNITSEPAAFADKWGYTIGDLGTTDGCVSSTYNNNTETGTRCSYSNAGPVGYGIFMSPLVTPTPSPGLNFKILTSTNIFSFN